MATDEAASEIREAKEIVVARVLIAVAGSATNCALDRLLECADISLYDAKDQGRDRIAVSFVPLSGEAA